MVQSIRSGTAVLAVTVALSCVLVLVCVQQLETGEGGAVELKTKGAKKDATSSTQAIQTILRRMEKSKGKVHKSQTRSIKDEILKEKSKLADLKLKDSKTFAQWEKEDEIEESAKTKALSLHELLQQHKTEEKIDKKKIKDLKAKLSRHLTAKSARSDLDNYYSKLDKEAEKTVPRKIKKEDQLSTAKAAIYKKAMEAHNAAHGLKSAKKTVSLKQVSPVNVWDTAPGRNEDKVAIAQLHLKKAMLDADKQIEKAEAHKQR